MKLQADQERSKLNTRRVGLALPHKRDHRLGAREPSEIEGNSLNEQRLEGVPSPTMFHKNMEPIFRMKTLSDTSDRLC
jgi:hypothetical protein